MHLHLVLYGVSSYECNILFHLYSILHFFFFDSKCYGQHPCRLLLEETSKPGKLRPGNTYFLKVLVYIADGSAEFRIFQTGAGDWAQQVKALATKPDDPSSIPRTHVVQVGN